MSEFLTRTPVEARIKSLGGKNTTQTFVLELVYHRKGVRQVDPHQHYDTHKECVDRAVAWGAPFNARIVDEVEGRTYIAEDLPEGRTA